MSAKESAYCPRRTPRDLVIEVRGLRYHLCTWGPESGPPVLLLHGWGDCAATWQFLVDRLPEHWRIIAPDWRGFGDSGWSPCGYWFPDYLADLEALLDACCPARAVTLVGHSMGGNIAALYAAVRPERVRQVVNLEGFGLRDAAPDEAPGRYRRWLDQLTVDEPFRTYRDHAALAHRLIKRNPHLDRAHALFVADAWTARAADGALAIKTDPAHRRVNPVLYRRAEAEACWREIVAPVLFVLARESHFQAAEARRVIDTDFGRAHYAELTETWLDDCGHMLHWERPGEVAAAITAFLQQE